MRTLVELFRHGGADLMRRWAAALLLAPPADRASIVESIEARLADMYSGPAAAPPEPPGIDPNEPLLHVADNPKHRDGYTEQTIRTYQRSAQATAKARRPPR